MAEVQSGNLRIRHMFKKSGLSGKTCLVLSTWFGSGLLPAAPGTFGTLAAVPLIILLSYLATWLRASVVVIVVAVAIWSAGLAQDLLKTEDPSQIVIDEVAGFLLAMVLLPFSWSILGLTFILFRIFDIFKPFPVRQLESLRGGAGIVMDDLMAGVYAAAGSWGMLLLRHALGS